MNKIKAFDCVKLKNELQEKLYKKLNPSSIDDYFSKLKKYANQSYLWEKIKNLDKNRGLKKEQQYY